ncbi:SDR family oxidoreductase [Methylocystis sp. MJC1]|uniref:SDR family oxidoreductase n=1 Tax=Methylocystis sp. MJC1 TaxID=2654282 RepID=UPI0013E9F29C|nr:SDR family oxidoreductase [Methylocystis sp. MJC1]KAF2989634.1 Serine 3-dehydrogenase [Methylocystis sp. MJC1]MBU6525658.1 SDR family oxidoreductase [Methylocystis sp. MJC1]UZX12131.1 SDR family oxidoreductase [Methylocystis sp. MJC1]
MTIGKRAIVVTGASTGIGFACVEILTQKGFFVFGSVRKSVDAERLQTQFGDDFAPLLFDVTDADAVALAAQEVETRLGGATLAGLVNNAGVAVPGPLLHLSIADLRHQLETNLIGQLQVTQAFAPLLGARKPQGGAPGRIVNMSSVAGRFASPFLGAYNASKFALEGMSDALRRELMIYGIDLIVIQPGVIATPIWDKADNSDFSHFDATIYGPAARRVQKWAVEAGRAAPGPELVAKAVLRALTAPRPPARIPVIPNGALGHTLPSLLPARFVDWLVARRLGFIEARDKLRVHHSDGDGNGE